MRKDYSMWGGKPRRSLQILTMIAAHGDSDECLEWPYTRRSDAFDYGYVQHERKRWRVHRLAFKLAKPDEFDPALHTLHKCDNPPCFLPKHLFQGTDADNIADKIRKGRGRAAPAGVPNPLNAGSRNGNSKLDETTALLIRQRWSAGIKQKAIADELKISQSLVSQIVLGRIWQHVR